ncbi:MAG: DUF2380 domain-containing protein [Fidelibacterota bacterium]|nr:MAG: DUF2380 domain-containing protein [Candidatus Neomarinimicrobiota bacterium]
MQELLRQLRSSASRAVLLIALLAPGTSLLAQKTTIAVLDFEGRGISQTEVAALSDRLRNELFRLEKFQVVERGMMETILTEQDFQLVGCTSDECLVEVGQLLGAQMMVGGSISKVGDMYTASARIVDVETSQVIMVADYDLEGKINDMLTIGMQALAIRLASDEKAPPSAIEERVPTPTPDTGPPPGAQLAPGVYARGKGGLGPCLASAYIGPRVGLEMNEGKEIQTSEWIGLAGKLIAGASNFANLDVTFWTQSYMAYKTGYKANGLDGCLASYFLGPRIGAELHERRIRSDEWLLLVPCVNIYPCFSISMDAYQGRTMTEIEIAEGLRK